MMRFHDCDKQYGVQRGPTGVCDVNRQREWKCEREMNGKHCEMILVTIPRGLTLTVEKRNAACTYLFCLLLAIDVVHTVS